MLRLPEQEDDQPLDLGAPTKRRASPEPDAGQPTTKSMKPEETKASEEQERPGPAGSSPVKGGYVHKLKKAWIKEYNTKDDADYRAGGAAEEHGVPVAGPAQALEGHGARRPQDKRPGEDRGEPGKGC